MKAKPLSKEEWTYLKFKLMKKGYTEDQANKELGLLTDTSRKNGIKVKKPEINFPETFFRLKQGIRGGR